MTPKEAFNVVVKYGFCGDCRWTFEDEHCIKCDCYQYVKFIKQSLEKQVAKKPEFWRDSDERYPLLPFDDWGYRCPCCGNRDVDYLDHHCECGQLIDWSEEE